MFRHTSQALPGGITVRRLSILAGMSLVVLTPALQAQAPAQTSAPAALAACLTCHGPADEAALQPPNIPPIPRVGGQHADYILKQLREFKAGKRKSDLMAPLLGKIDNRQLRELAAHFAAQTAAPRDVEPMQLVEAGRVLYEQGNTASGVPACVGCHLQDGAGAP